MTLPAEGGKKRKKFGALRKPGFRALFRPPLLAPRTLRTASGFHGESTSLKRVDINFDFFFFFFVRRRFMLERRSWKHASWLVTSRISPSFNRAWYFSNLRFASLSYFKFVRNFNLYRRRISHFRGKYDLRSTNRS